MRQSRSRNSLSSLYSWLFTLTEPGKWLFGKGLDLVYSVKRLTGPLVVDFYQKVIVKATKCITKHATVPLKSLHVQLIFLTFHRNNARQLIVLESLWPGLISETTYRNARHGSVQKIHCQSCQMYNKTCDSPVQGILCSAYIHDFPPQQSQATVSYRKLMTWSNQ